MSDIKAAIVGEIDRVASLLQENGMKNAATVLDRVSNTITSSKVVLAAVPDTEPGNPADEAARLDKFKAKETSSAVPSGVNNVQKEVRGKDGAASYAPDFASEETVEMKASKNKVAEGQNLNDLAEKNLSTDLYDLGDPADDNSTGALPETGHDVALDDDQKGQDLEVFGTKPEGSLHAARIAAHHAVSAGLVTEVEARKLFARAAAKVKQAEKDTPKEEKKEESKEAKKEASKTPSFVPTALTPVWAKAVQRVSARGERNMQAAKQEYSNMLNDLASAARLS